MLMWKTSNKAAWAGLAFLFFGLTVLAYAELIGIPEVFSHAGRSWNLWHYTTMGIFVLSAASFVIWYWFDEKDD